MVAPAGLVWLLLPLAFHADVRDLRLFFVGVAVAAAVLTVVAWRPALAVLLPVALAGELLASGLAGQASTAHPVPDSPRNQQRLEPIYAPSRPDVRVDDFLRPGPIARALE